MRTAKIIIGLVYLTIITGCVSPHQTFTKLAPGLWRGVLYLDDVAPMKKDKKDIVVGSEAIGELPFTFNVVYDNEENFHIEIHNGEERIKVNDIIYGKDKATAKDTVLINFTGYDTYISAIYEENFMEGYFNVNYKNNYKIKFKAFQGEDTRFRQVSNTLPENFNGRYELVFSENTEQAYPGVGDFKQDDRKITGTILTETGDYRYLEGNVVGKKAYLSCFDGSHAFLIEMKKDSSGNIIGEFRSGIHHREAFSGKLNEKAALRDGFDLVKKQGDAPFTFKLKDHTGKSVSNNDEQYKNKVKIYEIMGTWCPNCLDATNFLMDIKNKYPDVQITALAFERYRDSTKSMNVLSQYVKKTSLPYPILLAGYYDKKEASKVIPQIEKVMAYPTLLLVDKNDKIQKIYTGFYGPATKEHESFKSSFIKELNELKSK